MLFGCFLWLSRIEIYSKNHLLGVVETGESSNPSSHIVNSIVKERGAYGIEFISFPHDL
jgi:hypothetical protein